MATWGWVWEPSAVCWQLYVESPSRFAPLGTPERQSLCESHRQRRWLTYWSYNCPTAALRNCIHTSEPILPEPTRKPDADRTRSQMDMGCGRMMCDRCPILGENDGALHSTAAVRLGCPLAVRDGVERPWAVRGRARRQCPVTDMCGRVVVTARPEREVIRDEVDSSGETMVTSCKNAEQKEASHVRSKQGHGASHR
jgi:hypothetical protein